MQPSYRPILIVGPSGSGKTSVLSAALTACPRARRVVTATTRPPRAGERAGLDYWFMDGASFEAGRVSGRLIACGRDAATGASYGVPVRELEDAACVPVLILDPRGAIECQDRFPSAIAVYIDAPRDQRAARIAARDGAAAKTLDRLADESGFEDFRDTRAALVVGNPDGGFKGAVEALRNVIGGQCPHGGLISA